MLYISVRHHIPPFQLDSVIDSESCVGSACHVRRAQVAGHKSMVQGWQPIRVFWDIIPWFRVGSQLEFVGI